MKHSDHQTGDVTDDIDTIAISTREVVAVEAFARVWEPEGVVGQITRRLLFDSFRHAAARDRYFDPTEFTIEARRLDTPTRAEYYLKGRAYVNDPMERFRTTLRRR